MKARLVMIPGAILAASWLATWMIHRSGEAELRAKREIWQQQTVRLEQLSAENDQLSKTPARIKDSPQLSAAELKELLKLRNEAGQLRRALDETNSLRREIRRLRAGLQDIETNFTSIVLTALLTDEMEMRRGRVARLQQWLEETPSEKIPELQFLSELEWLRAVENPVVDTDEDCRHTMSRLRRKGEELFSRMASQALQQYAQANEGQFPVELTQLKPYFESPVADAVLERYQIVPLDNLAPDSGAHTSGDRAITQKAPVNPELDHRSIISFGGLRPRMDSVRWSSSQ